MNIDMITALKKPSIYTKSESAFWDDEYISKQMLKAHLDPDFEGASRKLDFIEQSASWIKELLPPAQYPRLLDIGCGPGIYAEKFAQAGYNVTGIDFSRRSIEYARQSAQDKNLDISYLYQNYLEMDLDSQFDLATMIYCDYGALSTDDRRILLGRIHHHLKPGGKLLLDVFSMKKFNDFQERQTWEISPGNGFWRSSQYMEINGQYKYSENVTLDLIAIITEQEITPYYLWNTCFSEESLTKEVTHSNFNVCKLFGNVAGGPSHPESDTIAILLERP